MDKLHIAYNIQRQIFHKANGRKFFFDKDFLRLDENDDIDELARTHAEKVDKMQRRYSCLLDKYGIAFDYSHVNIAWNDNDTPIALEVHKCRREYLFNFTKCKEYFNNLNADNPKREEGIYILNRIGQLL